MALVHCEISPGLRPSEATASVKEYGGNPQFIPVDREFLSKIKGRWYLPVVLLRIDQGKKAALVQLPVEADSGANRFWVDLADVHQTEEAPA